MGQKTNPVGARLGIIRGWESNWYGNKRDYSVKLIEDHKIRTYLAARINKGGIAKIHANAERDLDVCQCS